MNDLRLITPLEGQRNWGNAINQNFLTLLNRYKALCSEVQGMRTRFDELDSLKVQSDTYVYISANGTAYIENSDKWDNPEKQSTFNPNNGTYISYQAWFVKTNGDSEFEYGQYENGNPIIWQTGDLLIIHKQTSSTTTVGTTSVIIEQWKNIMGGYFKPTDTYTITNKGLYKRQHIKCPSFSTTGTFNVATPLIHWQPTQYTLNTGKLTFTPYYMDGTSTTNVLPGVSSQDLDIKFVTKGGGNYKQLASGENTYTIDNAFSNTNTSDMEGIGFDIHCTDENDANVLYFSYSYSKSTDKKLTITINRAGYTGIINIRVNLFYK